MKILSLITHPRVVPNPVVFGTQIKIFFDEIWELINEGLNHLRSQVELYCHSAACGDIQWNEMSCLTGPWCYIYTGIQQWSKQYKPIHNYPTDRFWFEFRALTAWGKKLLSSLAERALMLRYRLPDGRSWKRLWEGWVESFTMLSVLLEHRVRKMSRIEGRGAPMIFAAVFTVHWSNMGYFNK